MKCTASGCVMPNCRQTLNCAAVKEGVTYVGAEFALQKEIVNNVKNKLHELEAIVEKQKEEIVGLKKSLFYCETTVQRLDTHVKNTMEKHPQQHDEYERIVSVLLPVVLACLGGKPPDPQCVKNDIFRLLNIKKDSVSDLLPQNAGRQVISQTPKPTLSVTCGAPFLTSKEVHTTSNKLVDSRGWSSSERRPPPPFRSPPWTT